MKKLELTITVFHDNQATLEFIQQRLVEFTDMLCVIYHAEHEEAGIVGVEDESEKAAIPE